MRNLALTRFIFNSSVLSRNLTVLPDPKLPLARGMCQSLGTVLWRFTGVVNIQLRRLAADYPLSQKPDTSMALSGIFNQ